MSKKAFTLIELLIVIAIIGILSGLIVVSMSGAINSAKDAEKKANLSSINKAIAIYKATNGSYPIQISSCTVGGTCSTLNAALSGVLPTIPSGQTYNYLSADGSSYTLSTTLSDSSTYSYSSLTGYSSSSSAGSCGAVNGTYVSTQPSTNLCSTGTAGTVSGTGSAWSSWSWTCGSTSCSATQLATDWIDSGHGFAVMQYEAKNVSGTATSTATGTPWVSISQTDAITKCSAIGAHLITNAEWTLLARDAEAVSSNWSSSVMYRGHTDNSPANALSISSPSEPYNQTGNTASSEQRRTLNLANGNVIWDLSGNVWEWTNNTCTQGTGTGNWYNSAWIEWTDSNLSDYEKATAGPAGSYTGSNGVGRYLGCSTVGNAFIRGGAWDGDSYAGAFALGLVYSPSIADATVGFRCAR